MKTLIIPDIHLHHYNAEKLLDTVSPDKVIYLGDYFDDWDDTPTKNFLTACWLVEKLQDDRRVFLFGNHDISYLSGYRRLICSGYTEEKDQTINEVVRLDSIRKMKLVHWEGNILFSHAGYTNDMLPTKLMPNYKGKLPTSKSLTERIREHIDQQVQDTERLLHKQRPADYVPELLKVGFARGGPAPYGGVTWCDFSEFKPVVGINQVFGHTCLVTPAFSRKDGSWGVDLDCAGCVYGILEDNTLRVHVVDADRMRLRWETWNKNADYPKEIATVGNHDVLFELEVQHGAS